MFKRSLKLWFSACAMLKINLFHRLIFTVFFLFLPYLCITKLPVITILCSHKESKTAQSKWLTVAKESRCGDKATTTAAAALSMWVIRAAAAAAAAVLWSVARTALISEARTSSQQHTGRFKSICSVGQSVGLLLHRLSPSMQSMPPTDSGWHAPAYTILVHKQFYRLSIQ